MTTIERAKLTDYVYDLDELVREHWWRDDEPSNWESIGGADVRGDLSYEFDEVQVFKHKVTGQLLIAHDSGCSCPSPFEDTTVRDGRFIHRLKDFDDFVANVESYERGFWDSDSRRYVEHGEVVRHPEVVDQVTRLRKTVEAALAGS